MSAMHALEAAAFNLAAQQHGVITRAQLLAGGLTRDSVDHLVASGVLVVRHPGVYRVVAVPLTWHVILSAAVLAGGPNALASHRAAAHLWRLRGCGPAPPELLAPPERRIRLPGVITHRSDTIGPADRAIHDGIAVTSVARTLVDLGAVAPRLVESALEDARFQGLVSPAWMWRTVQRLAVPGRRGLAVMRDVLERCDPSQAPTESILEDRFLRIARQAGYAPTRQVRVGDMRLDFFFDPLPLIAEVDGRRWHSAVADQRRDRRRDNRLRAMGLHVVRFTWIDVNHFPADVRADLDAAAIASRRPAA
jgi:very-short-patch-repair endonuclease